MGKGKAQRDRGRPRNKWWSSDRPLWKGVDLSDERGVSRMGGGAIARKKKEGFRDFSSRAGDLGRFKGWLRPLAKVGGSTAGTGREQEMLGGKSTGRKQTQFSVPGKRWGGWETQANRTCKKPEPTDKRGVRRRTERGFIYSSREIKKKKSQERKEANQGWCTQNPR